MDRMMRGGWAIAVVLALLALTAAAAQADGFIVVDDPATAVPGHFSFAPLSVTYHHVTVSITDLVAVTTVDEEFFNQGSARLEGTYVFPLPAGAQIDKLSLEINGKMSDAELLPADKARAYYEEIVRRMKDPALLEYAGRGAFRLRVYPIEPHSGKRVRITYSQVLKNDAGLVEYAYPLSTEKYSSAPIHDVSVSVTLDGTQPLKSVFSPSHPAEVKRQGETRALVGWEGRDVRPDTDFRLIFSRGAAPVGIEVRTSRVAGAAGAGSAAGGDAAGGRDAGGGGYFMLLASPGNTAEKAAVQPKDIAFVLDTSGSMAGPKLDQAKKALLFCLANLGSGDRFEIIRFSTEAEGYFGGLVPADAAHVEQARGFVDGLRPAGGTAIEDALRQALGLRGGAGGAGAGGAGAGAESGRPYLVIFLTDGLPTVGETAEDPLVSLVSSASAANTRIFTFGIGTDVNTHLLDRIAASTRAASQYVLPGEDIELKVSSFYARVRDPVLSNLALSVQGGAGDAGGSGAGGGAGAGGSTGAAPGVRITQVLPSPLPDLFNGDMLVVFGRYTGSGKATVKISGTFNGAPHEFSTVVDFPLQTDGDSFVPRLWATRRVGWLLDEMRMHGESAELRDEVIRLAREFAIITPYTAYLVLEDEASRGVPEALRSFQEMESDTSAVDAARDKLDSVRAEAGSEAKRAGAGAVANSQAVQDLMSAVTVPQGAPAPGLAKTSAAGGGAADGAGYRTAQSRNYAQQAQVVNGRAFYQNNGTWTDSTAQGKTALARRQIRFGTDEYFGFLAANPAAAAWLALGKNVDVVVNGTLVSVRE
jgi:Ca-activated chloride channel family protein